jgi:hypothetical protein
MSNLLRFPQQPTVEQLARVRGALGAHLAIQMNQLVLLQLAALGTTDKATLIAEVERIAGKSAEMADDWRLALEQMRAAWRG